MGRLIKWLIPLLPSGLGCCGPWSSTAGRASSGPSAPDDPVVFSDYDVNVVVDDAGQHERGGDASPPSSPAATATASSATGMSPTRTTPGCARSRRSTSVLLDGDPVPYQMLWEDGERFRVAKIGDPDRTLSDGTHVFEIRYHHSRCPRPR